MAITVCTKRYAKARGAAPQGEGFWEFVARGEAVGNRKGGPRSYLFSTDGLYSAAKQKALEGARLFFGTTADVVMELLPTSNRKGE